MARIRPATKQQLQVAEQALELLKKARDFLTTAATPKSLQRLRGTIRPAEGAIRHLRHRVRRTEG